MAKKPKQPLVFYVDDEPHMLTIMSTRFKANDYRVLQASSGEEALAVLKKQKPENKPDLIVLDISMPVMNGIELCRQLKADPEFASIPVIMLTCMTSDTLESECISAGALGIIYKPHIRDLVQLMKRVLAGEKIDWATYPEQFLNE